MKREVKFRGMRVDNGAWIYGGYHLHEDVALCLASKEQVENNKKTLIVTDGMADWNLSRPINCYEVKPESIGEFIGLKDKNGVNIYEGDILRYFYGYDGLEHLYYEVKYGVSEEKRLGFYIDKYLACSTDDAFMQGEVIGNIYENPELL